MKKILIIEDEEDIRRPFQIFLEREGYEVWSTGNLTDFEEALDQVNPDLGIVDLECPQASVGLAAQAMLRKQGIRVLGMSGAARPEGFGDEFLQKPFGLPELLAAVRRLFGEEAD